MYLSTLLDRARYSPPPLRGALDRQWDHTVDLLASCGRLGSNRVKEVTWPLYICKTAIWAFGLREIRLLGQHPGTLGMLN